MYPIITNVDSTSLANILFLIPLHHFLGFSLERAFFEKLFFVIVFATACERDSDFYEIAFEIDLTQDETHACGLRRFSELEDVSAFEEESFFSQRRLTDRHTSLAVGRDMPAMDDREAGLE